MLEAIDCNKTYYDEYGAAVIVGVVKSYVVWRRPRAAVQVCTLNDFARRFSEKPHNANMRGATPNGGASLSMDGLEPVAGNGE